MKLTVDISDMKVSRNPEDILITRALGSCLGVAMYDPVAKVGGLLHAMMPASRSDPAKAATKPYMFVDTGVYGMLQSLFDLGARRKNLIVRIAGSAEVINDGGIFRIGERNYTVLRKVLWKNDILIDAEDVGGGAPRTMYLYISTGRVVIKSRGDMRELG